MVSRPRWLLLCALLILEAHKPNIAPRGNPEAAHRSGLLLSRCFKLTARQVVSMFDTCKHGGAMRLDEAVVTKQSFFRRTSDVGRTH